MRIHNLYADEALSSAALSSARFLTFTLMIAAALTACATTEQPVKPTKMDFDQAIYAHVEALAGAPVHTCSRLDSFSCRPLRSGAFRCTYLDLSEHQGKVTTIGKREGRWTWLTGDVPMCAVWVFESNH
jgi:hypothetical protein